MAKLTDVQKFKKWFSKQGFNTGSVLNSLALNPTYYKTENGDHVLVSSVHVCIFDGSNTKNGDLGCVTFSYHGKRKKNKCRTIESSPELFKEVLLPKSANEAIKEFSEWKLWTEHYMRQKWKVVF
jgi:hypothetical protein